VGGTDNHAPAFVSQVTGGSDTQRPQPVANPPCVFVPARWLRVVLHGPGSNTGGYSPQACRLLCQGG